MRPSTHRAVSGDKTRLIFERYNIVSGGDLKAAAAHFPGVHSHARVWTHGEDGVAPSVFISYRRDDAAPEAQLLSDAIRRLLGDDSVFMDVKSLRGGEQWPDVLKRSILAARVVVAVIGPEWARVADERGRRRITQKNDWVRLELATALNTANKLVIPVLVRNAKLPPDKVLPRDVRGLLQKNALEIRTTYFDHDVQLLTAQLKSVTSAVSGHSTRPSAPSPRGPATNSRGRPDTFAGQGAEGVVDHQIALARKRERDAH